MRRRRGRQDARQGWSAILVVGGLTLAIVLASRAGGPSGDRGGPARPETRAPRGDTGGGRTRAGSLEILPGEGLAPGFLLVDGMRRGALPVRLERVPAGSHRLHYLTGDGIVWESTVVVRPGGTEALTIDASANATGGRLSATSEVLASDGFRETSGDAVRIDGEERGVTPLTATVAPGWHSVRIDRRGHAPFVTVLEVPRGGARLARASFGAVTPLVIEVVPTLPAPGSSEIVLYGTLSGDGPVAGARMAAWILGGPGEDRLRVPMASVSGDPGGFVAVLDLATLPVASSRRYFLEAVTRDGDTVTSEILPLAPGARIGRPVPSTAPDRGSPPPDDHAAPGDSSSARLVSTN
jgi:hypothetical protein